MSKARTFKNFEEAQEIADKFFNDKHMLTVAMVQFAEREKIRVINQYRKNQGLTLIDTTKEPTKYPGGDVFEWIIEPPQNYYNDIDKPTRVSSVEGSNK
jgi:hypothetical protein